MDLCFEYHLVLCRATNLSDTFLRKVLWRLCIGVAECSQTTFLKKETKTTHDFQTICDIIFFLNALSLQNPVYSFTQSDTALPDKKDLRRNCDV